MNACPPDEELLPLADAESGIEAEAAVRIHVASCVNCTRRKERMSAEMRVLREAFSISQSIVLRGPAKNSSAGAMPATIGKYVIISAIGAGGQATVYRAAHKGLSREVVIKLARRSARPGDVDLLAAEGKILAELDHPNIAKVYDLDLHEGLPYLVMTLVRGQTLQEYAKGKTLRATDAAAIVGKVAGAIAYAQSRGVSHQDISPRNIIMSESGQPVVIDFGLARLGSLWTDNANSPSGGTPTYMAPEQARVDANRVESLADVFSLGAVLHFLLAGRSPYRNEAGKALVIARAGDLDIAAMENVPPALKQIVRKALCVDPAGRFKSAAEMADALEAFDSNKRKPISKSMVAIALAAVVGIAIWYAIATRPVIAQFPKEDQDILQVTSYATATEALPLRDGDRVHIEARIARGANVAAFWIAGETVTEMPLMVGEGTDFDTVSAPGAGADVPIKSPQGTEAVVIVASRTKLDQPFERGRMRLMLVDVLKKAPIGKLPDDTMVRIAMSGSTAQLAPTSVGRPIELAGAAQTPSEKATGDFRAALNQLKEKGEIDFYAGAAFPTRGEK